LVVVKLETLFGRPRGRFRRLFGGLVPRLIGYIGTVKC
jgi:hypothetical protein